MRVIDVDQTLNNLGKKLRPVDIEQELVLIDIDVRHRNGQIRAEWENLLAVGSYRADIHHVENRRVSKENVMRMLLKCQARRLRFLAIDCVTVEQPRQLLEFWRFFQKYPVVTALGPCSVAGNPALSRAWIQSELQLYTARMPLKDILDFKRGRPGTCSPSSMYILLKARSEMGYPLHPGVKTVWWIADMIASLLSGLYYSIALAFVALESDPDKPCEDIDENGSTPTHIKAMRTQRAVHRINDSIHTGVMIMFFGLTSLTCVNAVRIRKNMTEIQPLSRTGTLERMLMTLETCDSPSMYLGDILYLATKTVDLEINRDNNAANRRTHVGSDSVIFLLNCFVELCVHGETIAKGCTNCPACRMRVYVVLLIVIRCLEAFQGREADTQMFKDCFLSSKQYLEIKSTEYAAMDFLASSSGREAAIREFNRSKFRHQWYLLGKKQEVFVRLKSSDYNPTGDEQLGKRVQLHIDLFPFLGVQGLSYQDYKVNRVRDLFSTVSPKTTKRIYFDRDPYDMITQCVESAISALSQCRCNRDNVLGKTNFNEEDFLPQLDV